MSGPSVFDLAFYVIAFVLVASSLAVAFSRNLIYSAFGLLGSLAAVAALFVFLAADFLAITQILVYIGGILVLILFAVMLTSTINEVRISNRSAGRPAALLAAVLAFAMLALIGFRAPWQKKLAAGDYGPTTKVIGNSLLVKYILPFEIASVLLLIAMVGAVVLARKELKQD